VKRLKSRLHHLRRLCHFWHEIVVHFLLADLLNKNLKKKNEKHKTKRKKTKKQKKKKSWCERNLGLFNAPNTK
jgi:hypothetical protein